jgi:hypothetical protein
METAFDIEGAPADVCANASELELLQLCSLRCNDTEEVVPLQPLPVRADTRSDTSTNSNLDELPIEQQEAVRALMQLALEAVRQRHNKPKARFYKEKKMHIWTTGDNRRIQWAIENHHQCIKELAPHRNNNVELNVYMDRPLWRIHCLKHGCKPPKDYDFRWGRGYLDTSLLARIWPPPAPNAAAPDPMIIDSTPPPSPPRYNVALGAVIIPADQWDGESVIIEESSMPPGEWTWIRIANATNPGQEGRLSRVHWNKAPRIGRSKMFPNPVRIIPLSKID